METKARISLDVDLHRGNMQACWINPKDECESVASDLRVFDQILKRPVLETIEPRGLRLFHTNLFEATGREIEILENATFGKMQAFDGHALVSLTTDVDGLSRRRQFFSGTCSLLAVAKLFDVARQPPDPTIIIRIRCVSGEQSAEAMFADPYCGDVAILNECIDEDSSFRNHLMHWRVEHRSPGNVYCSTFRTDPKELGRFCPETVLIRNQDCPVATVVIELLLPDADGVVPPLGEGKTMRIPLDDDLIRSTIQLSSRTAR